MVQKTDEQPDMKKIEQRAKAAKELQKELEQCKKMLAGIAGHVKDLDNKVN